MIPPLITGLSWGSSWQARGLLNAVPARAVGGAGDRTADIFTWYGMILAQGLAVVPSCFYS
jgi:ABC-type Fe3+ transport system permease subunit